MLRYAFIVVFLFFCSVVAKAWDATDVMNEHFDKRQIVPLPRVGRAFLEAFKRQGIIPAPRVGRAYPEPIFDRNWNSLGARSLPVHAPVGQYSGRAKRSTSPQVAASDATINEDNEMTKTLRGSSIFELVKETNGEGMNLFHRNARQLIPAPRVGRRSSGRTLVNSNTFPGSYLLASANSMEDEDSPDPIDLQLRAVYIPRFGKRSPSSPYFSEMNELLKRAAFTPRIGRAAAFTPRLGRSSWDEDDLMYSNRVGRAAFTPRIGRSVHVTEKESSREEATRQSPKSL